jgi:hypothetical protein
MPPEPGEVLKIATVDDDPGWAAVRVIRRGTAVEAVLTPARFPRRRPRLVPAILVEYLEGPRRGDMEFLPSNVATRPS